MTERKDRIRIQIAGQEFSVVGGGFQEMLAAIKQINGRRFLSESKVWQLPGPLEEVERQLDISGYRLEGGRPLASEGPVQQPGGDRIRIAVEGHQMAVTGGDFQAMLALVKSLPGRRFDRDTRLWEIPGEAAVIKGMIQSAGYQLEGAEQVPVGPVPPMEGLDFLDEAQAPPPPFAGPDFDEDLFDIPGDWEDELIPPPFNDPVFFDEPVPFDPALIPPAAEETPGPAARPGRPERAGGDRIRLRLGETFLIVTGGSFQQMLAAIKAMPGRRFNGQDKIWELPEDMGLEKLQQAIKAAGFSLKAE